MYMTELNRQKSANEGLYESFMIVMKENLNMKEDFDFLNEENSKIKSDLLKVNEKLLKVNSKGQVKSEIGFQCYKVITGKLLRSYLMLFYFLNILCF